MAGDLALLEPSSFPGLCIRRARPSVSFGLASSRASSAVYTWELRQEIEKAAKAASGCAVVDVKVSRGVDEILCQLELASCDGRARRAVETRGSLSADFNALRRRWEAHFFKVDVASAAAADSGEVPRAYLDQFEKLAGGSRPDTLVVRGLPARWFCPEGSKAASPELVKQTFGYSGSVRRVEIAPASARPAAAAALPALARKDPEEAAGSAKPKRKGVSFGPSTEAPAPPPARPPAPTAAAAAKGGSIDDLLTSLGLPALGPKPGPSRPGPSPSRRPPSPAAPPPPPRPRRPPAPPAGSALDFDAYVQYENYSSVLAAAKELCGRAMKHRQGPMIAYYAVEVDAPGYMTDSGARGDVPRGLLDPDRFREGPRPGTNPELTGGGGATRPRRPPARPTVPAPPRPSASSRLSYS
eukprot:tig00000190_g13866.t1